MSDRDRPTSGHWSALTIKGRSFPSLAKLKISRRPAGRELEDWAEREMVRFGLMTRSSRDWGLRNGFDNTFAPLLLAALRAEAASTAGSVAKHSEVNGSSWARRLKDEWVSRPGLKAAQLADDLSHDINVWAPYRAIAQTLPQARMDGTRTHKSAPLPPISGAAAAPVRDPLEEAKAASRNALGTAERPNSPDRSRARIDKERADTCANKKPRQTSRSKLTAILLQLADRGEDIRSGPRKELHRRVLLEVGNEYGEIGCSVPTFERALKDAIALLANKQ